MSNPPNHSSNIAEWHISIHFCEDNRQLPSKSIEWRGAPYTVLNIDAAQMSLPFPMAFDEFIGGVNNLNGGYAEGDGSYGIVGPQGNWKVCGNIFEFADSIQYAEMIGFCPEERFNEFLLQLGATTSECAIQILQGGFFQSPSQFFESR